LVSRQDAQDYTEARKKGVHPHIIKEGISQKAPKEPVLAEKLLRPSKRKLLGERLGKRTSNGDGKGGTQKL